MANKLIAVCEQIGPELTGMHVLPRLKDLFNELAFCQGNTSSSSLLGGTLKEHRSKMDEEYCIESRMDLVWVSFFYLAEKLFIN